MARLAVRVMCVSLVLVGLAIFDLANPLKARGVATDAPALPTQGTRADGVRLGPYAVGFERRTAVDATRRINEVDEGTSIRLAIWYPAEPSPAPMRRVSSLEYRLLGLSRSPSDAEIRAYETEEVNALTAWRHVGIIAMTREQARACCTPAASR